MLEDKEELKCLDNKPTVSQTTRSPQLRQFGYVASVFKKMK